MPIGGSLTLGDVAGKIETLVVACSRCERAGQYPLRSLIERHGADFAIPLLLRELSPVRNGSQSPFMIFAASIARVCPDGS